VQRRTRVNIREDERISAQRYGRDALPRDPAWQVSRDQLGGTGQILPLVKYCRCTFFGHATPDRAGARPAFNVGSRDVTSAAQPTPLISFRVFSRVSRAHFLGKEGHERNPILDRSSCPLRPSVDILFVFGCSYAADRGQRLEPSLTLARSIVSRSFLIAIHRLAMRGALRTRITC
jgi:hypothetical protein